jgi:NTE family protein
VKIIPALPGADARLLPAARVLAALPPVGQLEQVLATAIVGHDQTYIERPCVRRRMIDVDTSSIGIIEFNADEKKRDGVVTEGENAAQQFLMAWNWDDYRRKCLPRTAAALGAQRHVRQQEMDTRDDDSGGSTGAQAFCNRPVDRKGKQAVLASDVRRLTWRGGTSGSGR